MISTLSRKAAANKKKCFGSLSRKLALEKSSDCKKPNWPQGLISLMNRVLTVGVGLEQRTGVAVGLSDPKKICS